MLTIPTNEVTVQPACEPVTVEQVKANAYIVDNNEDDAFIREQLIPHARRTVEELAKRSLITQTRKQYYDCIPYDDIILRYGPVQSVSSFTYQDTNEATQTISSTLYDLDAKRIPARLVRGYQDSWPTAITKTNSVAVTYVAGFGSVSTAVPIAYRRAIILICKHWYDNRDQLGCTDSDLFGKIEDMLAVEGRTLEYA